MLTACQSEPPEEISNVLLIGDAGALLTYFLGLSTARTLALAGPDFDAASDLASFMTESTMNLTYQWIAIEQLSAVALTLGWLVGATLGGALSIEWFSLVRKEESSAPLGVACTLVSSWLWAIPFAELGKSLAVAAVIMPVGGWLAFDLGTAVADLGGMIFAVALWRSVLIRL